MPPPAGLKAGLIPPGNGNCGAAMTRVAEATMNTTRVSFKCEQEIISKSDGDAVKVPNSP